MAKIKIETGSRNTEKVVKVLKGSTEPRTIKSIADEIGVKPIAITAILTSLVNKGAVDKSEIKLEEKDYKAYQLKDGEEIEITFKEKGQTGKMSDVAIRVVNYLKESIDADGMTATELGEALNLSTAAVVGTTNGLVKRGLVERKDVEIKMPDGEAKILKGTYLTEEGKDFQA